MKEEVIVLGFDGMDIDYLEEAMEERELENFEKLKEEGVLGELTSCHPPTTVPAWAAMFTGKNPGKLGAFHFQDLDRETGKFSPIDFSRFYGSYLWDSGIDASLVFMPGITPPYDTGGVCVEGMPGPKDFNVVPDLKDELVDEGDIVVFKKEFGDKVEREGKHHEVRKKVTHRILENHEQEFLTTVYRPTDAVAHFGDSMEDFYDIYEMMDSELGYFMDYANENDTVLLITSDHGANHTERAFFINTWLEKHGYLELNSSGKEKENNFLLKAANFLINLGLRKPLDRAHEFIKSKTGKSFKPDKFSISEQVDWKNSDTVAPLIGALPTTGVIINEDGKTDEEVEELQEELIEKLEEEDAVRWAKKREEVFHGDKVEMLPHVVVRGEDDVMMKSMIYPDTEIKFDKYGHGYEGILGAYGPGISSGRVDADIEDIAPTVLQAMNRAVPEDMDGEVIQELFEEEREVEYTEPIDAETESLKGKEERVKSRLEDLGYLRD
ncbi:MAG: alkaline phosphatase family protein [Candidatus Nanohaloarchaea archaeon]